MAAILDKVKNFGGMLKQTFKQWNERDPFNNSNVIAYYTIFSLPGLLVIVINLAGYFWGTEAVTNQLTGQIGGVVGGDSAKDIQEIVANANKNEGTTLSTILSIATLIFGATGVVYQLQQILNKMWEVKPEPKQAWLKLIKDRFFSFGLILGVGFLLLVSLALSAALTAFSDWATQFVPESLIIVFKVLDIVASIGVATVLFAAIFKFLPDAKIIWSDVWHGALLTAVLFVIAKFLLGLYFANADPGSAYGAAGSIILIMLWVSYAGLIMLFGAEFTQVYATRKGHQIEPTKGAVKTDGQDKGKLVDKPQPASKSRVQQAAPRSYQQARGTAPRKKMSFGQLMIYMIVTKVKKVL